MSENRGFAKSLKIFMISKYKSSNRTVVCYCIKNKMCMQTQRARESFLKKPGVFIFGDMVASFIPLPTQKLTNMCNPSIRVPSLCIDRYVTGATGPLLGQLSPLNKITNAV